MRIVKIKPWNQMPDDNNIMKHLCKTTQKLFRYYSPGLPDKWITKDGHFINDTHIEKEYTKEEYPELFL